MNLYNLLLVLLFSLIASANECQDRIEFHLGSKTPYRFVANKSYSKDDNLQGKAFAHYTINSVSMYTLIYI